LSLNPNAEAIDLLKENPDKIDWYWLSQNSSLDAVALLKKNPDKINWICLSSNPNAIDLLKENPDKIIWYNLSKNPSIFTYDYDKMRENMLLFKEDLMKERFHPRNLRKFGLWGHNGGIDDEDDE
jgi:hypothetical protein